MKKIFTILLFFIFITTNIFAVNYYVDQHHKNASDTIFNNQGLSWDTPFKSPTYAYEQTVDNRGDSIHITQGIYEFKNNNITYKLTLSKRKVEFVGYGEVIFEGMGKSITLNNSMFYITSSSAVPLFKGLILSNFYNGIYFNISATSNPSSIIKDCSFIDNYSGIINAGSNNIYPYLSYCCFINNDYSIYSNSNQISYISNSTFFNSPIWLSTSNGSLNYFINNNLFNSNLLSCESFNKSFNNNWFNSTSTKGYGVNATFHNPLFNDTNLFNPMLTLKRESPIRNISTTGSFLGAYGVADYSTSNDTLTWSGWYSWINDNDSVSIYDDSAFIVDTNGISLQYDSTIHMSRRITRVFSNLGTIYGTPLKSFSNQTEVFNTGDYIDYWAVIDYDTSTSIREYRYIASNEEITEEDLRENSDKWSTIGFTESLPVFTIKYFAVEIFFRYNF